MTDAQITVLILGVAFISLLLGSTVVRRRRTPLDLRVIDGYRVLPLAIDAAVESDRPPHFSLGASSVGAQTTLAALAASDLMYYLVKRMSFERRLPLVTLSDPITLAVASDTLRKAYIARNNIEAFHPGSVAWYPQGERSLAFAAGAASHATALDVSSHILLGDFGAELAYFGEAKMRRDQQMIANSITLDGQAVALAMTNKTIIGEELFVGGAYLDHDKTLAMGGLIAQDTLRWLIILIILVSLGLRLITGGGA